MAVVDKPSRDILAFVARRVSDRVDLWHRWIAARIQLAYGRWLRRQQRKSEARQPLRAALQKLDELGASAWSAEARGELDATGEHREAIHGALADRLSAQEAKIVHLAAQGLSNSEIGQQLGLSPRTVASHLYRIFPKLDITSRTQIAGALRAFASANSSAAR